MSGTLHDLLFGLGVATQPVNLIAGVAGVIAGTIIGVIPALGPTQGAALLLPVVFRLPPHTGLIFLSALYMGAIFGGSVTSILFNIPGTPMSVASAFDGYPMALKGQGSRALAGSALSAFIAGTVCIILFTLFARPLADYALTWGPPASFVGYGLAQRFSKHPEKFGTGILEGVVAPESAASAAEVGALLPMVTVGVPGSPTAAVILGAMLIWGLQPGPLLMVDHPEVVWGFIASMYIAVIISVTLNLFAIPIWTQILRIPFTVQVPLITLLCFIGGYTENNTLFTMWMVMVFGLIGFLFKKLDYPLATLVLAATVFAASTSVLSVALWRAAALSLNVLYIVWAALLLYQVTDSTGAIKSIGDAVAHLTEDHILQLLIIGFAFSSFLQGVAGFGVPVAVTAPLLIGLGFDPLEAAAIPLVGHAWAVTMGALASAFQALLAVTGLPAQALATRIAILLGLASVATGFAVAHIHAGLRPFRRAFGA